MKLQPYYVEPALRSQSERQTTPRLSNRKRALQLLDIDPSDLAESETQDLAAEVDGYLAAPTIKEEIDIIAFWEVDIIFIFVIIYLDDC